MKYPFVLFLDDIREPSTNIISTAEVEFQSPVLRLVARDYASAINMCEQFGCPDVIHFDHDLGKDHSGYDFAKWLVERDLDSDGAWIPKHFKFFIHSQNPVGRDNIKGYLNSYLLTKS